MITIERLKKNLASIFLFALLVTQPGVSSLLEWRVTPALAQASEWTITHPYITDQVADHIVSHGIPNYQSYPVNRRHAINTAATAAKVCELKGFQSYEITHHVLRSCGDDWVFEYVPSTDNWVPYQGCQRPDTIGILRCFNPVTSSQCRDGIDNDGDGLTDYPADPGCTSEQDNDESNAVSPPAACNNNLVINGDFEQGNAGFTSEYGVRTSCNSQYVPDYGEYLINANPQQCHAYYGPDNTHGKVMIVNTAPQQKNFWCETFSVHQNKIYTFSAEMRSAVVYLYRDSRWQWTVNGTSITPLIQTQPTFQTITATWNSGSAGTATLCGRNYDTAYETLDMVVDAISFVEQCSAACDDGVDNDSDGAADYPNDFSCSSPTDPDETNPKAQCQDGIDNDGDGKIDYPTDPGCTSKQDNDEGPVNSQCNDGVDNDNDGATDYPNDFSCSSQTDDDETNPKAQCQDGIDNDGDGKIDYPTDPGCTSKQDNDEGPVNSQCNDGVDNDNDGATDYPNDFSCSSQTDDDETNPKAQCQDGIDNDGDGKIDYPTDPGCTSKQDNDEFNQLPQCQDGLDNDSDGATDYPNDFSCSSTTDNDETLPKAQCQDGTDNDGDGVIDNLDPGCTNLQDNDERNICSAATLTSTCRCAVDADCTAPDTCQGGYCRPTGADLSVTKTGPSTVIAGSTVLYTVTAANAGPTAATNVVIADVIPAGLTFNAGQSSVNCVLNGTATSVLCNNFNLSSGQSRTFTIAFNVPATQSCGGTSAIANQATVSSSSVDPVSSNNASQTVSTTVACPVFQCNDGIDNDSDGAADYPNDFSCSSQTDNDETLPKAQCQDGTDNDGDGKVDYPQDPGCTNNQDNDEFNQLAQCQDGIDNDGDGAVDLADFSCQGNPTDNDETLPKAQCQDGIDNDGDGVTDYPADPGCTDRQDNDERNICPAATLTSTCRCAVDADCTAPDTCQGGYCRPTGADLSVTKTGPATVLRGNVVTYAVTATNNGSATATNVVITDLIPAGLAFSPADSSPGCVLNGAGTSALCNNFSLNVGESRGFTLGFTVAASMSCGSVIRNTADVSSSSVDPVTANNHSQEVTTSVTCPSADITIVKSGPQSIRRGGNLLYTITVSNTGPQRSENVVVVDRPESMAGLTFSVIQSDPDCVLNGTEILCNNISLQPNQSRSYNIVFAVSSGFSCGATIANRANANVSTPDPHGDNNWSERVVTSVRCGQCNDGIDNDSDGVTDHPGDFSCSDADDDDEANPKAQCQDGLDNDADGLTDYPSDPGCTSKQDNDEANLTSSDLSITKTGPATVNRGGTVSYTVTVTNGGTATALNAVVADVIPAGLTFHGGLSSTDCLLNGRGTSVLCNNFSLPVGQTKSFTITFNVPDLAIPEAPLCDSIIRNTATVSTSNDFNGGNNTSQTVSTTVLCPVQNADLSIQKTVSQSTVNPGGWINYTLTVANAGPQSATNVVISDALPSGTVFDMFTQTSGFSCYLQPSDASHMVCVRPSMAGGQSAVISYRTRVLSSGTCVPHAIMNTANVTSLATADPISGNNFAQASVQLTCPQSTFTIQKTDNQATVLPGATLIYSIAVTNTSSVNAANVTVTDTMPTDENFLSASDGGIISGSVVTWSNLSIPAGTTKTLTLSAQVKSTVLNGTVLINSATVAGQTAQDTTTVTVPVQHADLLIFKNGPSLVQRGSTILYTLTAYNAGPQASQNATIRDPVPTGLTFDPSQTSAGCSLQGSSVVCPLTLAAGQSVSHTVAFTVSATAVCGAIVTNAATVSSTNDPNASNDVSTVTTAVQCPNPTFTISKSDNQTTVAPGGTLTYQISVTNTSAVNATAVTVTDTLPSQVTFVSASDGGTHVTGLVTWSGLSINAGATKTLTVQANVSAQAANGTVLLNFAGVAGVSAQDATTVQVPPSNADLSIVKTGPQTVQQGGIVLYSLTVLNAGPQASQNVVISDVIPAGLTFNAGQSSVSCVLNGGGTSVLCNNFTLSTGESRSFTVAFNVPTTATCGSVIQNTAAVSTSNDSNGTNNTSQTIATTVQCPNPTFTISKTDHQTTVAPGGTLTYQISVANTSTVNATAVTVTDTLPSQTAFVSASGATHNGGIVTWNGLSINAGATKILTVQAQVNASTASGTVLTNTAAVSGITAQDTTTVQTSASQLAIVKSDNHTTAAQGELLTYVVIVANNSQTPATNLTITDTLPAALTYLAGSASDGGTHVGGVVTWTGISIPSQSYKILILQAQVNASVVNGTVITNTAAVAGISAQDTTTVQVSTNNADLSIQKTGPLTVQQGGVITYTLTATNAGPQTAQNVVLADVIPSGLTFNQVSTASGCVLNGNGTSVLCNNFSLASGQSRSFTVAFTVGTSAACGSVIHNTATVSSSNDSNGSNNTSQTTATTVQCGEPTFTLSKTDNRTTVLPGESLTYQISVTNTSAIAATNVQVTDVLPGTLAYVTSSDAGTINGSTVRWTLPSLAAGASKNLIVIAMVPSSAVNGTVLTNIAIVNAVTAQDTTTVSTGGSSSSSSSSECNLTVNLSDSMDPVNVGDTFTYTIEVRNGSSNAVSNVSLTQTIDSNVDVLSTSNGGNSDAGNTIRWNGLSLGGNTTQTYTTTVRVRTGREGALIRANAFACSAQDNENTRVTGGDTIIPPPPPPPPPGGAVLTLDKQADRTEAQAGSIIAYTIMVRNQSAVAVGPVTIEDTFNAGEMTVEYADGGSANGGMITWDIGTLGANATRLIHYRVRLSTGLQHGQTVSNSVRVINGSASDTAQVNIIRYFPQTGLLARFTRGTTDKSAYLQPVAPQKRPEEAEGLDLSILTWMILSSMGLTGGGLLGKKLLLGF